MWVQLYNNEYSSLIEEAVWTIEVCGDHVMVRANSVSDDAPGGWLAFRLSFLDGEVTPALESFSLGMVRDLGAILIALDEVHEEGGLDLLALLPEIEPQAA